MDSQPSGNSEELIFIETDDIYFTIKGSSASAGISDEDIIKIDSNTVVNSSEIRRNIYFKEYKNYEVIIESKNDSKITFYHDNSSIRDKITPTGRSGRILSGIINFRGDIAHSDLYVFVNGSEHLKVTVEVYPSKIDYKEDYKSLLNDVNDEIYNLAYGFLSRTYLGAELSNTSKNTYSEFYSILNYIYERLIKAIDIIMFNPHHSLVKESRVCKYHALKNSSKETVKWLEKRPQLIRNIDGRYIPEEALQITKTNTYNTNENRFLKFILLEIIRKIDGFIGNYNKGPWKQDSDVVNKLIIMKKQIVKRINTTFLRDINVTYNNTSISLVFSMASGYREVYKYYLMLKKGLNIQSNIFAISMKDLPLLYEYWCFIKINSLIREKYKLISSDFIKVNNEGIVVALRKGKGSSLLYENPRTKERFRVLYNSFALSSTVNQKPDNILSIDKEGTTKAYEFIFDAKYKVDSSSEYVKRYCGVGPKEEDINTMHRYRDAIVYRNKCDDSYKNCIFGAFVLFPYNDEEQYKKHSFYKSIDEVNIGGIPFLPSTTNIMEEFLNQLINESSYSTFERALDMVGSDEYLKDEYFTNRNVLVGPVKSEEQLKVCLEKKYYYVPKSKADLIKHNIEYVALAQSIKTFKDDAGITYYGKVKEVEEVKRCDIKDIPKESNEGYYKINIEQWKKLDKKIEIEGSAIIRPVYTSKYLLDNSEVVNDLLIKNKDEFREVYEMRRIYGKKVK